MSESHVFKLDESKYGLILKAFDIDKCALAVKSILLNHSPGEVYTDSVISPKTALVWNNGHNFFILGDLGNKIFYEQLSKIIYGDIFIQAKQKDNLLDFYIRFFQNQSNASGKYNEILSDLFIENPVVIMKYRYYELDLSEYRISKLDDSLLGTGISVEFIDESLLEKTDLINYGNIIGMIKENWRSEELFLKNGFGFCLIKDNSIISWCISDYNIDNQCEIGVETDDAYWRKGYATIAVTEVLNYCKQIGIRKVGWHCMDSNVASYKLAEKVGFKRMDDYITYQAWFNKFDNLLVNGYYYFTQAQNYRKAAECYEKAFNMKENNSSDYLESAIFSDNDNIKWCYYNTACAWALSGECEHAYANLQKAVKAGWSDASFMNNDTRLNCLKGNSKWAELLKSLEDRAGNQ